MPKSLLFQACFSEGKPDPTGCQCHQWPPVFPSHSIQLPFFQECTSVILSYSPSLFSPDFGALGSLRVMCVWLSQIYSSPLMKQDTVTSSVSNGRRPRLLSRSVRDCETVILWREEARWSVGGHMLRTWASTDRRYYVWMNGAAGIFSSEFFNSTSIFLSDPLEQAVDYIQNPKHD